MIDILSSSWMVAIVSFVIIAFNWILNRVKKNDGPLWGVRTLQAVLVVLSGLMIFYIYRMFVS